MNPGEHGWHVGRTLYVRSVRAPRAAGGGEGRSALGDQSCLDEAQHGYRERGTASVVTRNSDDREVRVL